MRAGGICAQSVPQPADPLREATAPLAVPTQRQQPGHRTTILCPAGGQDTHRDPHQGYAAQRGKLQLALYEYSVKNDGEDEEEKTFLLNTVYPLVIGLPLPTTTTQTKYPRWGRNFYILKDTSSHHTNWLYVLLLCVCAYTNKHTHTHTHTYEHKKNISFAFPALCLYRLLLHRYVVDPCFV
jgi:hypothetical protein